MSIGGAQHLFLFVFSIRCVFSHFSFGFSLAVKAGLNAYVYLPYRVVFLSVFLSFNAGSNAYLCLSYRVRRHGLALSTMVTV